MKDLVGKMDQALSRRILDRMDGFLDRRVCGQSLVEYVPSIFRDDERGIGGTGSQSTHYLILKHIFSRVDLAPEDCFLDVGCGKGRVLAFLVRENCACPVYGIEHNEEVGRLAAGWSGRYPQVHVIVGDALALDYDPFTVISLARSFLPGTFLDFTERLESTLTHPVTLIYWYDRESGHLLNGRPGWEMRMREELARLRGLRIARWPQSYSIWTYDPEKRKAGAAPARQPEGGEET